MPAIHRLTQKIPNKQRYYVIGQAVVLCGTLTSSVFGVIGLQTYIPAVVALVSAMQVMIIIFFPPRTPTEQITR